MRVRWQYLLPIVGLLLFAAVTYNSLPVNHATAHKSRYFFWSAIRFDSDPQNKRSSAPCIAGSADCEGWELVAISVNPGWLGRTLFISALPCIPGRSNHSQRRSTSGNQSGFNVHGFHAFADCPSGTTWQETSWID